MKNQTVNPTEEMPVIYTERLILRKMNKNDCDDMFIFASDDDVTRYLTWSSHPDKNYTYRYLSTVNSKYRSGELSDWALEYKGRMIGTCGFTRIDNKNATGEIGYVIAKDMQNKGFATEAANKLIEIGFELFHLNRMEARYMVGNDASLKVMKKLGMSEEGIIRDMMFVKGKFVSVGVCSILASEFFSHK